MKITIRGKSQNSFMLWNFFFIIHANSKLEIYMEINRKQQLYFAQKSRRKEQGVKGIETDIIRIRNTYV